MSDDIVARLRDPSRGSPRWADTMAEAADEIERLRSIQAEKGCKTDGNPCHPETCVCALAQQLMFEDAKNEQ